MIAVSAAGRLLIWVAIAFVGVALGRARGKGICQLFMAMLVAFLVNDVALKPLVHRPRPFQQDARVHVIGPAPRDYSFPSGHAAATFAAAVGLSRAWPGGTVAWFLLAALVSYSRLYLGVHYPSDVVAGALVGLACGWFVVGRTRWFPARSRLLS